MRYGVWDLFVGVIACFGLGFAGVSALVPERPPGSIEIRQTDYGARWPFEMRRGWLRCEGAGAIVLTVQGQDYAVNGPASSSYAPIQALWKGSDVEPGPIISRGLTLCDW
jgi:hypothetical protein